MTRKKIGLGYSETLATFDFETYSPAGFIWSDELKKWKAPPGNGEKGLSVVGSTVYTEHPDAEVLCLAYDLKDGEGAKTWMPGQKPPLDLFLHIMDGGILEAWNVMFERLVWNNICVPKYKFPYLDPAQLRCAMAKARAFCLPGSLEKAAEVLNTVHKKDSRGGKLLAKYSVPRNPTAKDKSLRSMTNVLDDDTLALLQYNIRDVVAESDVSECVPELSKEEYAFWRCDQEINHRGVAVDVEAIDAAIKIVEQTYATYNKELSDITGGAVPSASQLPKLTRWLREQGLTIAKLDKAAIEELLKDKKSLPTNAARALEIRQLLGSASVKKLYALKNRTSKSGRVHGLFLYHAARTGRATGVGPQPQNLPGSGPKVYLCKCGKHYGLHRLNCTWCGAANVFAKEKKWNAVAADNAISLIKKGKADLVKESFGDVIAIVSACLRGMFIAKEDSYLVCSDYSAIEAVVLAELSGEEWRKEVFRTHGKIYEMSASKITGVPFQEFIDYEKTHDEHHPLRNSIGKIAELASGYGGGVDAWKRFGATNFFESDDKIKAAVSAWRRASPSIVTFWAACERQAVQAVLNPGVEFQVNSQVRYVCKDDILFCILPSGRAISYHRPRLTSVRRYEREHIELSYEAWNSNPLHGKLGWIRITTYGGKLVENVVQAVARDILAHAIVQLEAAGFKVVLHVHDEIVAEVLAVLCGDTSALIKDFEMIMSTMPAWARGWPVRAEKGWVAKRYSK